ncbi:hypothetical protein CEXT_602571 [Caerostris extrusa]|uniref:Uncharacterized protein n=1 Tax=Caerostris extrusa TaxID=172846 RepID=A0AAV4UD74_CAEEX|nr:hypothetical protein CEXT_602571 [Caerostris extrusa]
MPYTAEKHVYLSRAIVFLTFVNFDARKWDSESYSNHVGVFIWEARKVFSWCFNCVVEPSSWNHLENNNPAHFVHMTNDETILYSKQKASIWASRWSDAGQPNA